VIARYNNFYKYDLPAALPYMRKADDAEYKQLAGLEDKQAKTPEPANVLAAADRWWEYGAAQTGRFKRVCWERAVTLYEGQEAGATGLAKVKISKRLADYQREAQAQDWPIRMIDLLANVDVTRDLRRGEMAKAATGLKVNATPEKGSFAFGALPRLVTGDYELHLEVINESAAEIMLGVPFGEDAAGLLVLRRDGPAEWRGEPGLRHRTATADQDAQWLNPLLQQTDKVLAIDIKVLRRDRMGGIKVTITGRVAMLWEGEVAQAQLPGMAGKNTGQPIIGAMRGVVQFNAVKISGRSREYVPTVVAPVTPPG
jgi:hypothetical protein